MKNLFFLTILSMTLFWFIGDGALFAQNQTTRYQKQHKSQFVKDHLKQTEDMLVQSLQSNSLNMNTSAAQTVRELEEIFPTEPFSSFIEPLSNIIKNEKADVHLRILSAIALDGLHSDTGDKAIYEVAKSTYNESLKDICTALAVESFKTEDRISSK